MTNPPQPPTPADEPTLDRRSFLLGMGVVAVLSFPTEVWGAPPSELVSRTFRTPRHTTHYLESGPADGPLMIFLHGWPDLSLVWRAQIEAFAAEGWQCAAPDMRGCDSSSI